MTTSQRGSARPYDSSGRRARAAELRTQMIGHAHDLFVANGYAATTIADVARASAVSPPTVFNAFGSKAALLKECIDVTLAGDTDATSVAERPIAVWVYDTPDPTELLRRYAVMMGELASRAAPIYDVLVRAADAEPELRELLTEFEQQRLRASTMVAEGVAERGGLPQGRTINDARDTVWLLNAPELYVALTRKRRWSTRRYVAWAANSLTKLLIEPADDRPPPTAPKPTRPPS